LPRDLARRAVQLSARAIAALPAKLGYVGIDLVLGEAADGSADYVIEVNPRLTTSYVGLRRAAEGNLAAALVAVAEGRPAHLTFRAQPLEFLSDGTILDAGR
jgi:predicted ATP-grasp superfamily ATP-dependent carboligase